VILPFPSCFRARFFFCSLALDLRVLSLVVDLLDFEVVSARWTSAVESGIFPLLVSLLWVGQFVQISQTALRICQPIFLVAGVLRLVCLAGPALF
jgi:hypothetical protein